MKNQYFGDINDYKKYSLLRHLSCWGQLKTVVCWLLTHDDTRGDGNHIKYLQQPDTWRKYDTTLYELLKQNVSDRGVRDVRVIENSELIANCSFYSKFVEDNMESRDEYFSEFLKFAEGSDLIFFDPDNGLEVKSVPRGKKNSSKYLYWNEVKASYEVGHSILIYQHFPRLQRDSYIRNLVQQFKEITQVGRIFYYKTHHVVFFLLTQSKHEELVIESNANILNAWGKIISFQELQLV
jgi:hypothetical protein